MRVLLAKTEDGQIDEYTVHRHHAQLRFDIDHLAPLSPTPPPLDPHGRTLVWTFDEDDLTLEDAGRPADAPGLAVLSGQRNSANQRPQNGDSREDYSWFADLSQVTTGAGKVNPVCFDDPAQLLAARLTLDHGALSVATIHTEHRTDQVWDFRDGNGDPGSAYRQALATWLEARIPVHDDHVDIVSRNFLGRPEKHQVVRLRPHNGREVKVDLILLSHILKPHGFVRDESFSWLYQLSEPGFPGPKRVPTRAATSIASNVPFSPFTTFCPGGGYDPYP